jgi:uncharacterized membrane protein
MAPWQRERHIDRAILIVGVVGFTMIVVMFSMVRVTFGDDYIYVHPLSPRFLSLYPLLAVVACANTLLLLIRRRAFRPPH